MKNGIVLTDFKIISSEYASLGMLIFGWLKPFLSLFLPGGESRVKCLANIQMRPCFLEPAFRLTQANTIWSPEPCDRNGVRFYYQARRRTLRPCHHWGLLGVQTWRPWLHLIAPSLEVPPQTMYKCWYSEEISLLARIQGVPCIVQEFPRCVTVGFSSFPSGGTEGRLRNGQLKLVFSDSSAFWRNQD